MHYLVRGKLIRANEVLRLSHEDFVQLIQSKVTLTLQAMVRENPHGKVLAGGLPAGGRDIVMIVDLRSENSHRCVRRFLTSLPLFDYYEWDVTPLDTFEEMIQALEG